MIIGLTGSMGSGKGEVVKLLQPLGFKYITLSEMVREEARRRDLPEEREQLMEIGNSMRQAEGNGVLAKRALQKIAESDHGDWVVDGIRNPAEIDALKENAAAVIIGLAASKETLITRIMSRGRPSDATTRGEILRKIEREWSEGDKEEGQQVGRCMEKVDYTIENEGTLAELDAKFRALYNELQQL